MPSPSDLLPSRILGSQPLPSMAERRDELIRLVPLWPSEIDDLSRNGRQRLVARLERALVAERRRGQTGHWTYDVARHAALLAAWRRERAALLGSRLPFRP